MRILEICLYSAGIDGVFARVKQEALLLAEKGHEVRIFSSNFIKGAKGRASENDKVENVMIKRFSARKLGGESYMAWSNKLEKEIGKFKPDAIIAHSYRHTHTVIVSRIAKEIGAKCFLVTHAPFGNENRSLLATFYIELFHDPFVGKSTLKRFDKIIGATALTFK